MRIYKNKHGQTLNVDEIKSQYYENMKIADIADMNKCSIQQIGKIVWLEIGEKRERVPKYTIDDGFFDVVDTEEKSYLLGFLMADGCVRNNVLTISIQYRDREILERIRIMLTSDSPIKVFSVDGHRYCRVSFYSKKLCDRLIELGCIPNKSEKLRWIGELLDASLMRHFVRGFFDGDGHFSYYYVKKKYLKTHFSITATDKFCRGVSDLLRSMFGYTPYLSNRHPESMTNNRTIELSGNVQNTNVLNWIYHDATIFLNRKHKKYMEFKKLYV